MINIALDQNDITTRRSPTGHVTGLPPSPPQAKWQGRPSPGVEAVLSRDAALDGSYLELFAPWASNHPLAPKCRASADQQFWTVLLIKD